MKTKKKVLLPFLALFLLVMLSGLTAAAKSAAVAMIGSQSYDSLEAAVKKVKNNETIVLKKNVTYSKNLQLNVKRTYNLNLNNKTIMFNAGTGLVVKKGTVAINKGGIAQKGAEGFAVQISKGASLTIRGGSYKGRITNKGTLNISGGTFASTEKKTDLTSALLFNYGKLTVSGGTFDGKKNVVMENHRKAAISGGTFKNSMVQVDKEYDNHTNGQLIANLGKGTTLNITGGTFTAGTQCLLNGPGSVLTVKEGKKKCSFSSKNFGTIMNFGTLTINGGTYSGRKDWPIVWTEENGDSVGSPKTTIKNGTFTSEWTSLETYGSDKTVINVSGGTFTSKAGKSTHLAMLLSFGGKINVTGGSFTARNIDLYWYDKENKEAQIKIAAKVLSAAKTKGLEMEGSL